MSENGPDSWLFLGYGAGLFYLMLNPGRLSNAGALRKAFLFFLLSFSCTVTSQLAVCIFDARSVREILHWIAVFSSGLFLFSLIQLWKAVRGTDLL